MASQPNLSTLPKEILFSTFKLLDRPSKTSLALTSPQMLHLFASYYDLDRYRGESLFTRKIALPDTISWQDPSPGAIIRWLAMPGADDIDDPPEADVEEEEEPEDNTMGFDLEPFDSDDERFKPYEETAAGIEEAVVQGIIGDWLKQKCGVDGGVVFCAECYKFMRLRKEDGSLNPWAMKQFEEPT